MKRAWNKIEKILLAYQKDMASIWHLENNLPSFHIIEDNNTKTIELKRDGLNLNKISLCDIFFQVLSDGNDLVKILFNIDVGDRKRKSILWIIANTEISLEEKKKLINLFFNQEQLFRLPIFFKILKKVKDSQQLVERKLIALYLLSIAKPKECYSGGTLKSIIDELNVYDYYKEDFYILENFFSIYKKEIKGNKNSIERVIFVDFLKKKIKPDDWDYFKHLYDKDKTYKKKYDFEENANAKMHLIFNIDFIKEKYKFLSLENDVNIALEKISKYLLNFHNKFNLEELHILKNDDEKFVIYLVSKNNQKINKVLIVKVFYRLMDEFSRFDDLFENKNLIEKLIDCELLYLKLNDKDLKDNIIIKI